MEATVADLVDSLNPEPIDEAVDAVTANHERADQAMSSLFRHHFLSNAEPEPSHADQHISNDVLFLRIKERAFLGLETERRGLTIAVCRLNCHAVVLHGWADASLCFRRRRSDR